jgi:hypothetical protein
MNAILVGTSFAVALSAGILVLLEIGCRLGTFRLALRQRPRWEHILVQTSEKR